MSRITFRAFWAEVDVLVKKGRQEHATTLATLNRLGVLKRRKDGSVPNELLEVDEAGLWVAKLTCKGRSVVVKARSTERLLELANDFARR